MSRFPAVSAAVFESCVVNDPHNDRNKIVLYTMQCAAIGANRQFLFWAVARRFSEFVAFHKELRANWTLDDVALPALPPKRLKMFGLDLSDKLRDSRSRALSEYLDVICKYQSTLANDAFLQDFFGLNLAVIVPSNTPTNPVGDSNQGTEHAVDGDNDLNLSLADVLVDEAAPFVGAVLLRQPRSVNADDVEDVQEPDENVTAEENPCSSTVIRNPAAVTTPLADVTFSGQQAASQRASCRSHHNLSSIYLSSLGSAGTRVQPVDVSDFGISPIFAALNASSETTSRDCNPLDMSLARKAVARRKLELALALAQANTSPALPPRPRAPTVDDGPSTPPPVGIPTNAREDIDRGPRQDEHTDWHPLVGVPPSLEDCGEDTLQNIDPMQRSVMVEPFLALEACGSTARVPPACGLEDCFDENPVVTPVFAGPPVGVVGKVCGPTHQQDNQDSELHVSSPLPVAVTTHTQHDSGHSTKPIQHTDAFCGVEAFSGRRHKARRRMHQNPHKVCVGCAVS